MLLYVLQQTYVIVSKDDNECFKQIINNTSERDSSSDYSNGLGMILK